ncbi:hypothetical protein ACHAWF_012490 [Thalassiosira exigua]
MQGRYGGGGGARSPDPDGGAYRRRPMEPEDDVYGGGGGGDYRRVDHDDEEDHPDDEPAASPGGSLSGSLDRDGGGGAGGGGGGGGLVTGAEDAVLDLAELEQLQEEAERMKGLGNKHMAAQEYTRAYNAYSAALQLSPVGPSSHVFLSNRAASLLSLKRYSAAAVDARRAVALAPTFGKAHARLGQALYFLKQYRGAVEAYEDALKFEEDDGGGNSAVTKAYLQKAREKLARQEEKERRKQAAAAGGGSPVTAGGGGGGDDVTAVESVSNTIAYSVATDKDRVGLASGLRTSSARVDAVAAASATLGSGKDSGGRSDEQLPLQKLSINEGSEKVNRSRDSENTQSNDESSPNKPSPMGSPFKTFHDPNPRSSPSFMTVQTGPMGGPAQRRVEPKTTPQGVNASGDAPAPSPPLNIPTPTSSQPNEINVSGMDDNPDDELEDEPDPDFDEALRLQRRATHFLQHKQYRIAVDEFSAALFLVPDDPVLSPQLHVGRAHALNGQERFESATNDALMALKHILRDRDEDASAAEAYSVLGKSLYYCKDYQGAMEALEESARVWESCGGRPSVFDEAYLDQCREALDAGLGADNDDGTSVGGGRSVVSNGAHTVKTVVSCVKEGKSISNIPKLKPPRFVPREKVRPGILLGNCSLHFGLP